jgi:hypothetical protein
MLAISSLYFFILSLLKLLPVAIKLHGYHIHFYNLVHCAIHAPLLECIFDLDTISIQLFIKDFQPVMNL